MDNKDAVALELNVKPDAPNPLQGLASPVPSQQGTAAAIVAPTKVPTSVSSTAFKTPKNTILVVIKAGAAKALQPWNHTFILGIMAGVYLSMAAASAVIIAALLAAPVATYDGVNNGTMNASPGMGRLALGVFFPSALFLIVIAGGELFTGNVMYLSSAFYGKKAGLPQLAKSWFFSYFGNLVGCLMVAYFLLDLTEIMTGDTNIRNFIRNMAVAKVNYGWGAVLLKGIGCNMMVCLALWNAISAEDVIGKFIGIWCPLFIFVVIGFEHCIANMLYIPLGIMSGSTATTADFIGKNLVPVTIGNIIGGLLFGGIQYFVFHEFIAEPVKQMKIQQGHKAKPVPAVVLQAMLSPVPPQQLEDPNAKTHTIQYALRSPIPEVELGKVELGKGQ